eukprot:SAG22_NODE_2414_length_2601_cov_1.437650_2_plen_390_part_00
MRASAAAAVLLGAAVLLAAVPEPASSVPQAAQRWRQLAGSKSKYSDGEESGAVDSGGTKTSSSKKSGGSWWGGGKSKVGEKGKSKWTGPAGKMQARFDDKAAKKALDSLKSAGKDLAKTLGMKGTLPKVDEYSKKGWHFQLPNITKALGEGGSSIKVAADELKAKMKQRMKQVMEEKDLTVEESQDKIKPEQEDEDAEKYEKTLGKVDELAKELKKKQAEEKLKALPAALKKAELRKAAKLAKMPGGSDKTQPKPKPPAKPSQWDLMAKKADKQAEVEEARAFDDAVFDQIRQAEVETGQKLRPGAYFKILDKNQNGVLELGESPAVDELFATADIIKMNSEYDAEEGHDEKKKIITYEQYKTGIRDARQEFKKLRKQKLGHITDESQH